MHSVWYVLERLPWHLLVSFCFCSFLFFGCRQYENITFPRGAVTSSSFFYEEEYNDTRARNTQQRDSFPRVIYIYIYLQKTFNASSFVFVGWSFVLLKETRRRSERRRKKSSTDDRKHAETSLRFCSKFTCIDFFARARFSLSRAALSREEEEEKKKKHKEEQRTTQKRPSERRRRRRQEEKKSARRRHRRHLFLEGQLWAPKTVASFSI